MCEVSYGCVLHHPKSRNAVNIGIASGKVKPGRRGEHSGTLEFETSMAFLEGLQALWMAGLEVRALVSHQAEYMHYLNETRSHLAQVVPNPIRSSLAQTIEDLFELALMLA